MANYIVLGAQWGDEGKGKIVDMLAGNMDMVVRFQGGANAGHTVIIGDQSYVLHLIPGGIVSGRAMNIIGNGCVVDPIIFTKELTYLRERGLRVTPQNLMVSGQAHIVTPVHRHLDRIMNEKIGTTGRGIGPAYVDKIQRTGIRAENLIDGTLEQRLIEHWQWYEKICSRIYKKEFMMQDQLIEEMQNAARQLKPFVGDTTVAVHNAAKADKHILFEGAQGAMLDVDHGSYPFVTSSSTTIGGAYSGSGVYMNFDRRIAVVKAYTTRVGEGPFPTELNDALGEHLRKKGNEYGATTGRPRRCGWLDLKALRRAFINNGFNYISLSKISCLSGLESIKAAVDYDRDERPIYETFPGWQEDIEGITDASCLPKAALHYIDFIAEYLQTPIGMISTGPDRNHIIIREALW